MQEKTFTSFFKKNLKSMSPPSRLNQFSKNQNLLPQFLAPRSPTNKKFTKIASPISFPEIDSQVQLSTKQVLGSDLYEYTNKVVGLVDMIETAKLRKSPIKKVLGEKDEANMINKYRNIREKCLNNEIKLVRLLNELKEEVKNQGISEKTLSLAMEILSNFNMAYSCNDNNPLEFVKNILNKFCYLQQEELMGTLMKILSFESTELKNMPLLFLLEKICVNLKKMEKKNVETVTALKFELEKLHEKNRELKESNFQFAEKIRKIEAESRALVDKELSFYREKVSLNRCYY